MVNNDNILRSNYLQQIFTKFKNLTLNAVGAERSFYEFLRDGDVDRAIAMMQDNEADVDNAIAEYNWETHKVMSRPNKNRKNDRPYITEKLPRTRQRYINEVELFFLLGNPIVWEKTDGDDEAYSLFTDFLKDSRFDAKLRQMKRLAGAETEAAIVWRLYQRNGEMRYNCFVVSRSEGYRLRPLFDQYGNMMAFAYGYQLKEGARVVQHWDILTADFTFSCRKNTFGWEVSAFENKTGRINAVYAKQTKAWDGAEQRINREEQLDSKIGDTNNYFADPIAAATADVVSSMTKPESVGSLIQLTGQNSRFEYINPPQSSEARRDEMTNLEKSILFDTFTPDFSFDNMRGMGTLSGVAIKNAMVLGYIKRANRIEIYGDLVGRCRNVVLGILKQFHPEMSAKLDALKIDFSFAEPFDDDKQRMWQSIGTLRTQGVISIETAVKLLSLTDAPTEEIERLRQENEPKEIQKEEKEAE